MKITRSELRALSSTECQAYNKSRFEYHARFPILRTNQVDGTIKAGLKLLNDNRYLEGPRLGLWLDAESTTGKTTTMETLAAEFIRSRLAEQRTDDPLCSEYVPLVFITLPERPTPKFVNHAIGNYLNADAPHRAATSNDLAQRAALRLVECRTEAVILDDAHALDNRFSSSDMTANHLKYLMTIAPITFLLSGADIEQRTHLLNENEPLTFGSTMAHRFGRTTLSPHQASTNEWTKILRSLANRLVLCDFDADGLLPFSDVLFHLSGGFMGSLRRIVHFAANEAITSGKETITEQMLRASGVDYAADVRLRLDAQKKRRSRR